LIENLKETATEQELPFFFTTGTKNTFVDRIEKDFYQEFLTKTNHAVFRFSQEKLTMCCGCIE